MDLNTGKNKTSWCITVAAGTLLTVHLLFPTRTIDVVSLFLFAFAVVPWLGSIFTKLELPGGLKFEYPAFERAAEGAKSSGLLGQPAALHASTAPEPAYVQILDSDPNLALAGLRIEIEQRLVSLASSNGVTTAKLGLSFLLRDLSTAGILTESQAAALQDILRSLNGAAHGAQIKPLEARAVMNVGRDVLASLTKLGESRFS